MALDDRDRTFEKALARHLRYVAPAGADSDASLAVPCPDAEILAAYHDGSLDTDELALWKQHVVSCENCQLILEHLAAPLDVAAGQQSAEKNPPEQPASAGRPPLQIAAPSQTARSAPATEIRPRRMYLRWLAPAGAIAAVLLVMVVVERSRSVFRSTSERVETANNRQPASSPVGGSNPAASSAEQKQAATAESRLKEPLATANAAREKDQFAVSSANGAGAGSAGAAAPEAGALAKERGLRDQRTPPAANQYASSRAHGPALSAQQQQRQQSIPPVLLGGPPVDAKKAKEEEDAQLVEEGKALASKLSPPTPPPSIPENQPSFLADDSLNRRAARKAAPAATPAASAKPNAGVAGDAASGAMAQTVTVEASSKAIMNVRADAFPTAPIFGPPAGNVLWRVGAAGSIEHSTDSGTTWSTQASGVSANLITGFALSPKVCWVVGASGIILRTTDGGAHWIKISPPVAADLISVRSTDAFHATVSYVDDPATGAVKSFKTGDGGVNWSSVPNE